MALETLVVVVEEDLVGMTNLVIEETSVVKVTLVAAVVVEDMVVVGMAIMDLVTMEVILEVAEAITILAITTHLQIVDPQKEETGGRSSAPVVMEANTWPNHKTKVAVAVPAAAVAIAVAEGFIYCQETK